MATMAALGTHTSTPRLRSGFKSAPMRTASVREGREGRTTRSEVLKYGVALLSLPLVCRTDPAAAAESGFGRYVKKRALEPLQSYVLPLLAAKIELQRAGRVAGSDLGAARSLLREGALSGLRFNARAVGEYAERLETSTVAPSLVTDVNRSVEQFDAYLLRASRKQEDQHDPTEYVAATLGAIDKLLATVPQDVMDDVTGKPPEPLEDADAS